MINMDDYPKLDKPAVARIDIGDIGTLGMVRRLNRYGEIGIGETFEILSWDGSDPKNLSRIPENLRIFIPQDAGADDAFVFSDFSAETLRKIVKDAWRDEHMEMARKLHDAMLDLESKRFPQD